MSNYKSGLTQLSQDLGWCCIFRSLIIALKISQCTSTTRGKDASCVSPISDKPVLVSSCQTELLVLQN